MNRYLTQSLAIVFTLLAGVALFNYWVDPYAIFRIQSATTERISRLDQVYTMRLAKPWQVSQLQPSAVVIGSSRTASIRPSGQWARGRGYNLSMPGLSLYEMTRLVEHAHHQSGLARLAIGLEQASFVADWSGGEIGRAHV